MDVTSLLNAGASAVDQQKQGVETMRLPTRSRTPWDAGGYSLPLNLYVATKSSSSSVGDQTESRQQFKEEEDTPRVGPFTPRQASVAPTSPIHKFTDSRSSLSSFASSSLHSANHSRYSSISTLNSPRTLSVSLSEQLQLSPKTSLEVADSRKEEKAGLPQHSPNAPLDALAQIAEYHSSDDHSSQEEQRVAIKRRSSDQEYEAVSKPFRPQHHRSISSGGRTPLGPIADILNTARFEQQDNRSLQEEASNGLGTVINNGKQPRSVADMSLTLKEDIIRPSSPSDTLLIKRPTLPALNLDTGEHHLSVPHIAQSGNPGRAHKRALSAPNFAAMGPHLHRGPIVHEPTPPTSNHPDHASPQSPFQQSPPDTPPSTNAVLIHAEPTCMYIDDCDTDSPQRKAISHIFGRNKMCTRMIPERLWVHLCRKHYQRCRYRDANKWAKVQCDLVQIQIRRIHEWSMNNQLDGEGDGIRLQSWSLAMRKREKMRREIIENNKRKRGASSQDDLDDCNQNDSEYPSTQTKVPDWLVDHCGREFSTQGILAIFNRLHQDVLDGHVGPQFPDIELLPNLLLPEDGPSKTAVAPKPRKAHQRSQSLNTHSSHESKFRDHAQKRRRPNEDLMPERILHSLPPARMGIRRPTYPSINEHEETYDDPYKRLEYQQSVVTQQPSRYDADRMPSNFESTGFRPSGRPMHQRSQSDMGAFTSRSDYMQRPHQGQSNFQFPSYASQRETERATQDRRGPIYNEGADDRGRPLIFQPSLRADDRNGQLSITEDEHPRFRQYSPSPQRAMIMEREHPYNGHNRHKSSPAQHFPYPIPSHYANHSQARQSPTPFVSLHERRIRERPEASEDFALRR